VLPAPWTLLHLVTLICLDLDVLAPLQVQFKMVYSGFIALAAYAFGSTLVSAQNSTSGPDKDGKYTIQAEGIRALFIPYGASLTNLFVNDSKGIERDIVLGFDNATAYTNPKLHPHFGGVPGMTPCIYSLD
jgi:hypothetical protein